LLYYAIPVFGVVLCWGALFVKPDHRIKVAFTVFACTFSIYLMEGALDLRDWKEHYWPSEINQANYADRANIAKRFGVDYARRTRLQVIQDLRRTGIDAVPSPESNFFMKKLPDGQWSWTVDESGKKVFPLAGISRKTSVFCNENGPWTIYEADEHG